MTKVWGKEVLGAYMISGIALIGGVIAKLNEIDPSGAYLFSAAVFVIASYVALSKSGKLGSFGIVK